MSEGAEQQKQEQGGTAAQEKKRSATGSGTGSADRGGDGGVDGVVRGSVGTDQDNMMEDLKMAFKMFDRDGGGTISIDELRDVMKTMGLDPTDAELKTIISDVDTDGDGEIDFDEFVQMMMGQMDASARASSTVSFQCAPDLDNRVYISTRELNHVMRALGEEVSEQDLKDMIATADLSGGNEGQLDYKEFVAMVMAPGS